MSIYDCALITSESLFKAAGSDSLSENATDNLENYLSILITVIDDKILKKKTIADLRM